MTAKPQHHEITTPLQQRTVDVILPIFGDHTTPSLEVAIESLIRQTGVALSVIVAYLDGDSATQRVCERYGLQCVSVSQYDAVRNGRFIPGVFRNAAIRHTNSEFIYNGDVDIVYLSSTFFADLIDWSTEHEYPCLFGPPMRRMPVDIVSRFINLVRTHSLDHALGHLILDRPFLATLEPASHRTIVFRDNPEAGFIGREPDNSPWLMNDYTAPRVDRLLVYLESDYSTYRSSSQNVGKEPFFCTQDVHCGGTLAPRRIVINVGGFCEEYAGWGCHDYDLQAKLHAVSQCALIPRVTRFCVMHLDHERRYFDKHQWRTNRQTLEDRSCSIKSAIVADQRVLGNW